MLSNDVSEWSAYLRRRFSLDRLFASVVISGDHGFRKPDRPLYEVLLRSLGVAPHRCVLVDDQPRNLETQRNWECTRCIVSETIESHDLRVFDRSA
jgi:putative hydrolase of the HAD superfamily